MKDISLSPPIKCQRFSLAITGDNAVAESFFKTLKTELIYHHRYQTKQQAALSVFEYIETWYNKNRRHNHLNNLTILEHENLINNNLKNAA